MHYAPPVSRYLANPGLGAQLLLLVLVVRFRSSLSYWGTMVLGFLNNLVALFSIYNDISAASPGKASYRS